MRPAFLDKPRGLLRRNAHHRAVKSFVSGQIISQRRNDAGRSSRFGRLNREAQFLQRSLRLEDERVRAGLDERTRLFFEGRAALGLRQFAVRLEQRTQGADVAQHITRLAAKGLARDAHGRLIDFPRLVRMPVTPEAHTAAAKRIRNEAIRAGFDVTPLDSEDMGWFGQVPHLAAGAVFQAGQHQLGSHGAVANEAPFLQSFKQRWCHRNSMLKGVSENGGHVKAASEPGTNPKPEIRNPNER